MLDLRVRGVLSNIGQGGAMPPFQFMRRGRATEGRSVSALSGKRGDVCDTRHDLLREEPNGWGRSGEMEIVKRNMTQEIVYPGSRRLVADRLAHLGGSSDEQTPDWHSASKVIGKTDGMTRPRRVRSPTSDDRLAQPTRALRPWLVR